jgi:hypothetical protein
LPDGPHLDPGFWVPLCRRCHYAEHAGWCDAGLDVICDPVLARLHRTSWIFGRLADLGCPVTFGCPTLRGLQGSLLVSADLVVSRYQEARA